MKIRIFAIALLLLGSTLYAQNAKTPEPLAPKQPPRTGMMVDDLSKLAAIAAARTPLKIDMPASIEETRGYFGFGAGTHLPKDQQYPVYSSIKPAHELPLYIQQELYNEYAAGSEFRPQMPSNVQQQNPPRLPTSVRPLNQTQWKRFGVTDKQGNYRPEPAVVAPNPANPRPSSSTSRFTLVSSVGILEEDVGKKGKNRDVVAILYLAIVDMSSGTPLVLKNSAGVAAISYRELDNKATGASRRFVGAGKLARELVLSALYDPVDRGESLEKFLARRHGETAIEPAEIAIQRR
jgi:hypothetical protein